MIDYRFFLSSPIHWTDPNYKCKGLFLSRKTFGRKNSKTQSKVTPNPLGQSPTVVTVKGKVNQSSQVYRVRQVMLDLTLVNNHYWIGNKSEYLDWDLDL